MDSFFAGSSSFPNRLAFSSQRPIFKDIIFNVGDFLFSWKPSPNGMRIPQLTFKHMLRSIAWFDYEKGLLSQEAAYTLISQEYGFTIEEIISSFDAARATLQVNSKVLDLVKELKGAGFCIYAMRNISDIDLDYMASKADPAQWTLFDKIFTSAAAHERHPYPGFYSHVISEAGLDPSKTIFVDDRAENLLTARSFGIHGIRYEDCDDFSRQLKNLCGDPVERGNAFLLANKGKLLSTTSRGFVLLENYSQVLIWEATGNKSLVDISEESPYMNFFPGGVCPEEIISDMACVDCFPNDLDTTSLALTMYTHVSLEMKHSVMDRIISLRTVDGLTPVYFSKTRPRLDFGVCINVLTLFYRHNRGKELDAVLDWVYNCLLHDAILDGTLYYPTPELVLWFLSRLLQSSSQVRQRFEPLFKRRIMERLNMDGDSLALAMRIISAASVGIESPVDVKKLLSLQQEDGSWTDGWYYKLPRTSLLVKNDGLSTAFAIQAIRTTEKLKSHNSLPITLQSSLATRKALQNGTYDDCRVASTKFCDGYHDTDISGDREESADTLTSVNGSEFIEKRAQVEDMASSRTTVLNIDNSNHAKLQGLINC